MQGLNKPFVTRSEALGIKFILRALSGERFTGTVRAENIWHKVECVFEDGSPIFCRDAGLVAALGNEAFVALCGCVAAEISISPISNNPIASPGAPNISGTIADLLAFAEKALTDAEQAVLDTNLVTASNLKIDEAMLGFYANVAPSRLQPILQALMSKMSPRDIIATVDLPPTEIEDALRDLVRKRIIMFGDAAGA
jgi:hypothetical protein